MYRITFFSIIFLVAASHSYPSSINPASLSNNHNGKLSVFLDAPWWFDSDFVREQIPIVNYVRDKEVADVHILMTRHGAGSAGTNYSISFIGRGVFRGFDQDLTYWARSTNSSDDTRRGYTNMIKIGLVKYIATTPLVDRITVDFDYDEKAVILANALEPPVDPWNSWVFELYGGGNFRKEERQSNVSSRFGFFADRITDDWKIRVRPYFNHSKRTYITDEDTIISRSHRHGHEAYVVKSINDHWSVGVFNSSLSSTFHNMRYDISLVPAIEYSYFPYHEATRRSVTFAYRMGWGYRNYIETTIFAKDSEFLWSHSVSATARFQQPWGNFRAGISGSHFFHDVSINRANIFANINIRLFQGFALNVNTNLNLINDLIAIPAGDLSLEEILLEQSQQATSYNISGSIGLSYTFGSDFSAAFNPRL
ncbi:MAG: hypothetical protein RG741_07285 [Bacteroidales bacterium]|nr:hypothetical protein [Bacteroidales bacterium]